MGRANAAGRTCHLPTAWSSLWSFGFAGWIARAGDCSRRCPVCTAWCPWATGARLGCKGRWVKGFGPEVASWSAQVVAPGGSWSSRTACRSAAAPRNVRSRCAASSLVCVSGVFGPNVPRARWHRVPRWRHRGILYLARSPFESVVDSSGRGSGRCGQESAAAAARGSPHAAVAMATGCP